MNNPMRFVFSILAALAFVPAAAAQTPAEQGHSSGDWRVRCLGEGAARICDAVQSLVESNGGEVIRLSIVRQKATGVYGVQLKTPLGFRLDSGAMVRAGAEGAKIEGLVFNRCTVEGCFAERPLGAAEVAILKNMAAVEVVFLDLKSQPVILALSSKGLARAIEGL